MKTVTQWILENMERIGDSFYVVQGESYARVDFIDDRIALVPVVGITHF